MSKLVSRKIIYANNGIYGSQTNKCGTISISQGTCTNHDFISDFLQIEQHEQLDILKFETKLRELSNLVGFKINVHMAKYLEKGFTRVWLDNLYSINPTDHQITYNVHILWYGHHFEYIKWEDITNYPEFNESIFNQVKIISDTEEELLMNYNFNLSM